jgi:hypothetical protein
MIIGRHCILSSGIGRWSAGGDAKPPPALAGESRLVAGSGPVTGQERAQGLIGPARECLDNVSDLRDLISPKNFRLIFLKKYPEKFAGKYRQKCPESCTRLRRHVCLHLNSDLCLNLNLAFNLNLNLLLFLNSFQQLFQKSFALLFGFLFVKKSLQLQGLSYLAWYRQTQPGERPLGRPLHGRIVARHAADTTSRGSPSLPDADLNRPRQPCKPTGKQMFPAEKTWCKSRI